MDDNTVETENSEGGQAEEATEVRRVAAVVLTELARAAKVATWTIAALVAAAWLFSGIDSSGYFTGPFDFPGRYLVALLPVMLVWFTLKGSAERLVREANAVPTPSEAETS